MVQSIFISQLSPDNYFIIPKRKASFDFILLDFGVILVVNAKIIKIIA